jgi:DNA-binding protein HU-beta
LPPPTIVADNPEKSTFLGKVGLANPFNGALRRCLDLSEMPRNALRTAQFCVFRAGLFQRSFTTMATQPATAAKPKVNTVSLKHLAAALAETHEMPKKQGEAILGDLVNLITKHLKKGDRIRLVGLGVLVVRKRAARMGRNPATGEPIQIKASKKVAFRASKELKEAV